MSKKTLLWVVISLSLLLLLAGVWFYAAAQFKSRTIQLLEQTANDLRKGGIIFANYSDVSIGGFPGWSLHVGRAKFLIDLAKVTRDLEQEDTALDTGIITTWTVHCSNTKPLTIRSNFWFSEYRVELQDAVTCYNEQGDQTYQFKLDSPSSHLNFVLNESPLFSDNVRLKSVSYVNKQLRLVDQKKQQEFVNIEASQVKFSNDNEKVSFEIDNKGLKFSKYWDDLVAQNNLLNYTFGKVFWNEYGVIDQQIQMEYMGPSSFEAMKKEPLYFNIGRLYHQDDTGFSEYQGTVHLQPSSYPWPNLSVNITGKAKASSLQYKIYEQNLSQFKGVLQPYFQELLQDYIEAEHIQQVIGAETFTSLVPRVFGFGEIRSALEMEVGAQQHKKYGLIPVLKVSKANVETELFDIKTKGTLLYSGERLVGKSVVMLEQYPQIVASFLAYSQRVLGLFNTIYPDIYAFNMPRNFPKKVEAFLKSLSFKRDDSPPRVYIGMAFSERSAVPKISKVKRKEVLENYRAYITPYLDAIFLGNRAEAALPKVVAYRGKYASTLNKLHQKALAGDMASQYRMGVIYAKGAMGVARNKEWGGLFLDAAGRQGHPKVEKIKKALGY